MNTTYYRRCLWRSQKKIYWGGFNPELYPKKICVDEKLNPQNSNTYIKDMVLGNYYISFTMRRDLLNNVLGWYIFTKYLVNLIDVY